MRLPVEFRYQIMGMYLVLILLQGLILRRETGRAFRSRVLGGGAFGAGANGGHWALNGNRVIGTGSCPTSQA